MNTNTSTNNNDTYFFSNKEGFGWLAGSMKGAYLEAGSWDYDAKEVSLEVYTEYALNPAPSGKMLGSTKDGYPCWINIPPPTKDQLIAQAEEKKSGLMYEASKIIAPLQDAIDLRIATEDEEQRLVAWKTYRILLNRVDISAEPYIEWPKAPI